jgi:hypothetical protein
MCVEVSTLRIPLDQLATGEEGLSATVVPRLEVNLGQPEGIIIIFCCSVSAWSPNYTAEEKAYS